LPIRTRKEFLRRVERALADLEGDTQPGVRKRATEARNGLLKADSTRRKSLLRLDFDVVLNQLDVVTWAIDAYQAQRNRRLREDEEFLILVMAARARGYL